MLSVTFLGTATASGTPVIGCSCQTCRSSDPRDTRWRSSILLSWGWHSVVVDTGPEFRLQMLRAGVGRLDAVLMTHEHADHIYGMDDVRMFTARSGRSMPVFARDRTAESIRRAFSYIFESFKVPGTSKPAIDLHEIDEQPFELFGKTIQPIPILHGKLPIFGYRIDGFAYLTDCSELPVESEPLLQGLDTLVLGALRHEPHPTHFSLEQAIETSRVLKPRRTLFTHIGHDLKHAETSATLPPGFEIAYDGLAIKV